MSVSQGPHVEGAAGADRVTARQRRVWSSRVDSWNDHGSAGLTKVTEAVLEAASVRPGDRVLDLGCGTGQLSLPMAAEGAEVLAVDISPAMVARLEEEATDLKGKLEARACPIEDLDLPAGSFDMVVSSYALHHLRDGEKAEAVRKAFSWLRPGGRLLIADMMLGRGASHADRVVVAAKVKVLVRMGPGGWWRIAKNAVRFTLRMQERPITMEAWRTLFEKAGFEVDDARVLRLEAGLVSGRRPGAEGSQPG